MMRTAAAGLIDLNRRPPSPFSSLYRSSFFVKDKLAKSPRVNKGVPCFTARDRDLEVVHETRIHL